MSLVWIIPALFVSVLTIAVVLQLLEGSAPRWIASAVGVLMLVEGSCVLLTTPTWSAETAATTAIHGVAMVAAGAGIWAIAYRALFTRQRAR